jgi:uncharacterized repeat protein (TIGR03806 family)
VPDTIATNLSATGCVDVADARQPAPGVIPYDVNTPFWSDGATKSRYLGLPDNTTIAVAADGDMELPPGAVVVKHFRLGSILVETRLLMRHPDGSWAGYTYAWNEEQTDATRVIGGGTKLIDGQTWIYPSETQCMQCHTAAMGDSLGLEILQLNRDFLYPQTGRTDNQLATLGHIGVFAAPLADAPADLPKMPDLTDSSAPLSARARAYLHTNCSQCHRPGGPTPSGMDWRYDVLLENTSACDTMPQLGDLGIPNARIIAPGASENSVLLSRIARRDVHGMPPVGSAIPDAGGIAVLTSWVDSLAGCN